MSQVSGEAQVRETVPIEPSEGPAARATYTSGPQAVRVTDVADARAFQDASLAPGFVVEQSSVEELMRRMNKMERRLRMQALALVIVVAAGLAVLFDDLLMEGVIVQHKLMESKELTLLDNDGNARLFLRMYSKVPVLQIMDSNGRPRISLGLRFDDTPFLDLSDRTGRTRATFEMTADDAPALRMFDENGNPTFNIN